MEAVDAVECPEAKSLVLVGLMNKRDLNNERENMLLKAFVMEEQNAAKVRFALRAFER